jgi:hypothetical protein
MHRTKSQNLGFYHTLCDKVKVLDSSANGYVLILQSIAAFLCRLLKFSPHATVAAQGLTETTCLLLFGSPWLCPWRLLHGFLENC